MPGLSDWMDWKVKQMLSKKDNKKELDASKQALNDSDEHDIATADMSPEGRADMEKKMKQRDMTRRILGWNK